MTTLFDLLTARKTGPSNVSSSVPVGSRNFPVYGGTVPSRIRPSVVSPGGQPHPTTDPMAPAPISPTFGRTASFTNSTWYSAIALATTTTAGQPCALKNMGDITTLRLDTTETLTTTGSCTTGILFASVFDHWIIQSPEGDTLINCPGGSMMELLGMWGSYPPGNLINNTLLAAQATAQSNTQIVPGLRLPQKQNAYNFIPTFNTIAGAGSANATADTISINVSGDYGNAGGLETHFISQTYTVAAAGYTDLGVTSVAKNQIIAAALITGITTSAIDEFYVETNGGVVEGLSAGSAGNVLNSRMTQRFVGTAPSSTLIYVPPSKWVANDGSYLRVHNTTSSQTWTVGWYWLQVPKQYGN